MPTSPTELRELAAELDNRGDSFSGVILRSAADRIEQLLEQVRRAEWDNTLRITPTLDDERTLADLSIHPNNPPTHSDCYGDYVSPPNDMTVCGPTYCPHCGAPPAEHHNGTCLRFPAMQPPLA